VLTLDSLLDGTPTLRLNEFILAGLDKAKIPLELPEGEKATEAMPEIQEITFKLDHHLEELIHKSAAGFAEEMAKQDMKVLHYTGYGKNAIKAHKASPDAWAQMVMQLAFFRLKKRPGVTYESAQTRKFLHGRTEVIRSASAEAKAWCEAMVSSSASDEQRVALFRKAVTRHIQYSTWAADGQGVDRHLFGLKKLLQKGEDMPEIFTDSAFAKSSHWELSTSQLGSAYLDGWGYGEGE
jgi:carnitine O-acetyltransferase